MSLHRLLERQIKRVLAVDPGHLSDIEARLGALARRVETDDPQLSRTLAGLPALFERISEGYAQFERDQTLIRRSLELSSGELTDANRLLREKSSAASQALASLSHAFDLLLEGYQDGPSDGATDNLVEISQKVLWLTQQRERISLALKHSEERFELAMQGANDGLWDWDVNNSTVYYSPRWKAMIGHTEDEIGDTPDEWSERIHPADLPGAMAVIYEYFRGNRSHYESTFRFRHKDGHYLWILSRGIAVRDAEGNVTRLVGTQSDITARVELEQHLSQFKRAVAFDHPDSNYRLAAESLFAGRPEALARACRMPADAAGAIGSKIPNSASEWRSPSPAISSASSVSSDSISQVVRLKLRGSRLRSQGPATAAGAASAAGRRVPPESWADRWEDSPLSPMTSERRASRP